MTTDIIQAERFGILFTAGNFMLFSCRLHDSLVAHRGNRELIRILDQAENSLTNSDGQQECAFLQTPIIIIKIRHLSNTSLYYSDVINLLAMSYLLRKINSGVAKDPNETFALIMSRINESRANGRQ